ncbi:MAG: DUF1614 domain-containing protein [Candidatus Bathyarchaeia archaeon]
MKSLVRKVIYWPFSGTLLLLLFLILLIAISLLFAGFVGYAFMKVGFSPQVTAIILLATFAGSYVNIPVFKIKALVPMVRDEYVSFFGLIFKIPQINYEETFTVVALNVGGALIPSMVSIYLLWRIPKIIVTALTGTIIVALVTYLFAKPVKGLGIATPAFIPPLTAATVAYVIPSNFPAAIAYISGVLGTLIGADLANLNKIPSLGAKVASIGGAGTFDGIFLSGVIAALLT